jgi:hypothetical protein
MECEAKQSKALNANSSRDRNKPSGGMVHIPREISRSSEVAAPAIALLNDSPGLKMPSELSSEQSGSAEELQKYLILTNNSNHYQLLGVTADSSQKDIKYSFYCLARKFHPDRHMSRPDWVGPLQHLMAALPKAYVVLRDDHKRNNYGKQLALASIRSEAEESIDDSAKRIFQAPFFGSANVLFLLQRMQNIECRSASSWRRCRFTDGRLSSS